MMRRWVGVLCWLLLACLSLAVATKTLSDVLPVGVATRISHNAEGYLAALLIAPWVAVIRAGKRVPSWSATGALSLVLFAVGVFCSVSDAAPTLKTLDEGFYSASILVPYVRLSRPLPRAGWALPGLALLLPITLGWTEPGLLLAEVFGMLVVLPVFFDWADRTVLEPQRAFQSGRVIIFAATLVVLPIVVSALRVEDPDTLVGEIIRYLSRPTEAAIAGLLLVLYFSVVRRVLPVDVEASPGATVRA